jgi:ribosomal protein S19E (S16A)
VQIPPKRRLIRYCVDWSEQRHHLSGALGRGLLDRLIELGWVRRSGGSRAVKITETGQSGLDEAFGISA